MPDVTGVVYGGVSALSTCCLRLARVGCLCYCRLLTVIKMFIFVLPLYTKEPRGSVVRFPAHYAGVHVGGLATGSASLSTRGHNRSASDGYGPTGRGGATARAWLGP